MSVWVQSRSGNEEAIRVDFKEGMDFHSLKEAITLKRDFLHFPAGAIHSIHSENNDEERFKFRVGAKVPIPADGQIGSSDDLPYFFSIAQTQAAAAAVVDQSIDVNISYGKLKEKANVRNYQDLVVIIPQLFDKLTFTDFDIVVDKICVSSHNFAQRVVSGCTLVVESLSLPFSDYKVMAQVEDYAHIAGLEVNMLHLPDPFLVPEDSAVPAAVVQELEARLEVFDVSETTECIMREFIGPVLVGAIRLLGPDSEIKIRSEHKVVGKRGRGPLDYDLLFKLFHVIVCEAKNGKDVVDGIPQNTAQLVACREVSLKDQRKRKRDNQFELDAALQQIPSFGIVSTGRSWVFLKYHKDVEEDRWKLERSVEYHLPLAARIEDRTGLRVAVVSLLQVVAGVLHAQREEALAFEARMSNKRSRTTSTA